MGSSGIKWSTPVYERLILHLPAVIPSNLLRTQAAIFIYIALCPETQHSVAP